jgi:hypothetical protein
MKKLSTHSSPQSAWELLPMKFWEEIIPFAGQHLKMLVIFSQISRHNYAHINNSKNYKKIFYVFTTTFCYLKPHFSPPSIGSKPLAELGYQVKYLLELFYWPHYHHSDPLWRNLIGQKYVTSCLKPDSFRQFTVSLEIGDIDGAINLVKKVSHSWPPSERALETAKALLSWRTHGGKTFVGELQKSLKPIKVSTLEGLKIYSYNNAVLDTIFAAFIDYYFTKYIPQNVNCLRLALKKLTDSVKNITHYFRKGITTNSTHVYYNSTHVYYPRQEAKKTDFVLKNIIDHFREGIPLDSPLEKDIMQLYVERKFLKNYWKSLLGIRRIILISSRLSNLTQPLIAQFLSHLKTAMLGLKNVVQDALVGGWLSDIKIFGK